MQFVCSCYKSKIIFVGLEWLISYPESIRIRILPFRSFLIRILPFRFGDLMTKKGKIFTVEEKIFVFKNGNIFNLRPPSRSSLQKRSSSTSELCFCVTFWPTWIQIQLTKVNDDPCGFRSTRLAHLHLRFTCWHRCQTLTVASGRPPTKKKRVDKAEDSDVEASLPNQPYVRSAVLIKTNFLFWRAEMSWQIISLRCVVLLILLRRKYC